MLIGQHEILFPDNSMSCQDDSYANWNRGQDKPASPWAVTTSETQECFAHCYLSPGWLLWQLQEVITEETEWLKSLAG